MTTHPRLLLLSLAAGLSTLLASCAGGPTYAEAAKTLPPIPKGKGRVFVYRTSVLGAAITPKIRIDGTPIGTSKSQGFSYSDQAPGQHEVSLITEWKHKDSVTVSPGKPSFVRTHATFGALVAHVIPTAVDQATGEQEIQKCKLVTE